MLNNYPHISFDEFDEISYGFNIICSILLGGPGLILEINYNTYSIIFGQLSQSK